MARVHDQITPELQAFIEAQPLFFVATAPLSTAGHVNLSPKGLDSLRVLSSHQLAYLDLTGSGNETSAHLQENGRITLMICAFTGPPQILRLYGRGHTVLPGSTDWEQFKALFPDIHGSRQIIVADITRIQTSCGMGVPLFEAKGQRQDLLNWASHKSDQELVDYRRRKNQTSIDGLVSPLADSIPGS